MKAFALRQMRRRAAQPFWDRLAHVSMIGRNYWGAAQISRSGEIEAMRSLDLPPDPIVVDVGANIGDYSVQAVRLLNPKRVYALEPSTPTFNELCRAIESNGLQGRVMPRKIALGAEVGDAVLHSPGPGSTIASFFKVRNPYEPYLAEHDERVEVTTLDAFAASEGIDRIGLLKIDVEGVEFAVLEGGQKLIESRSIDAIQFEFGEGHIDARTYMRDFFDLLGHDYMIFRIASDGLHPIPRYSAELEVFASVNYFATLKPQPRTSPQS